MLIARLTVGELVMEVQSLVARERLGTAMIGFPARTSTESASYCRALGSVYSIRANFPKHTLRTYDRSATKTPKQPLGQLQSILIRLHWPNKTCHPTKPKLPAQSTNTTEPTTYRTSRLTLDHGRQRTKGMTAHATSTRQAIPNERPCRAKAFLCEGHTHTLQTGGRAGVRRQCRPGLRFRHAHLSISIQRRSRGFRDVIIVEMHRCNENGHGGRILLVAANSLY